MIGKTVSHYKIIEELGRGGMGEVYLAEDTKLKRQVAIKFLPEHLTKDKENVERFGREAEAAAALNHPNIVTIHDVIEEDGPTTAGKQICIVMEYVDGKSLREYVGAIPIKSEFSTGSVAHTIDQTISIISQIAEGLSKAHQAGIVHRDIKPENIIIDKDGRVKILDFGLAKLKGVSKLTKETSTLGTIHYMSPKQLQGKEVDHRSDIWSLGVVLYEMLTGEAPFKGEYESAVMYAILNEEPATIKSTFSDIPEYFNSLIGKVLQKKPSNRFQSTEELLQVLKTSTISSTQPDKKEKSIIVLPFDDMSPDKDNEYFSDGLTEEIISDLSQIHNLLVISRSSAMTFKGSMKKIKQIANEVNVRYVLEGSVRKAENKLRITAQLIDAETDAHLWVDKYSGTLDDVFDIQEKVSQSIVNALKLRLSSEEIEKIKERPIDNVLAYDCYLRAYRESMSFSKDRLEHALNLLHKGIDIIGENAVMYAGIAFTYFQYANLGTEQEKHIKKAEEFVTKAFNIDPELAEAHFVLGCIYQIFHGKAHKAIDHLQRAYSIKPDDPEIMFWLAWGNVLVGRTNAAIDLTDRCIKIDPINPMNYAMQGINHFFQGRFDLALSPILDMQKIAPQSSMWQFWKSITLLYNDCPNESHDFINEYVKEPGIDSVSQLIIFLKYVLKGDKNQLSSLLTPELIIYVQKDNQLSWHMATFYSYLIEKHQSLEWLENAVDRGFINYPFLDKYDKLLENIRGEERFKKLMKRVKYEWENFEV
jgi:non-specific serine/threonine protein kinase